MGIEAEQNADQPVHDGRHDVAADLAARVPPDEHDVVVLQLGEPDQHLAELVFAVAGNPGVDVAGGTLEPAGQGLPHAAVGRSVDHDHRCGARLGDCVRHGKCVVAAAIVDDDEFAESGLRQGGEHRLDGGLEGLLLVVGGDDHAQSWGGPVCRGHDGVTANRRAAPSWTTPGTPMTTLHSGTVVNCDTTAPAPMTQ